jgi:hypothetical protein
MLIGVTAQADNYGFLQSTAASGYGAATVNGVIQTAGLSRPLAGQLQLREVQL